MTGGRSEAERFHVTGIGRLSLDLSDDVGIPSISLTVGPTITLEVREQVIAADGCRQDKTRAPTPREMAVFVVVAREHTKGIMVDILEREVDSRLVSLKRELEAQELEIIIARIMMGE
jgi:hypothetical protein